MTAGLRLYIFPLIDVSFFFHLVKIPFNNRLAKLTLVSWRNSIRQNRFEIILRRSWYFVVIIFGGFQQLRARHIRSFRIGTFCNRKMSLLIFIPLKSFLSRRFYKTRYFISSRITPPVAVSF